MQPWLTANSLRAFKGNRSSRAALLLSGTGVGSKMVERVPIFWQLALTRLSDGRYQALYQALASGKAHVPFSEAATGPNPSEGTPTPLPLEKGIMLLPGASGGEGHFPPRGFFLCRFGPLWHTWRVASYRLATLGTPPLHSQCA